MTTLVRELDRKGDLTADRVACVVGGDERTYGALAAQVRAFASGLLELGLRPGDRVSLYLPNCADYVVCFYGAMRAGMLANPINHVLTPREVEYLLRDSGASVLVTTPELGERLSSTVEGLPALTVITTDLGTDSVIEGALGEAGGGALGLADVLAGRERDLPYPDGSAPACLPYSSGTTGRPKGIVHTHDSLSIQAVLSANALQLRAEDVLVQALPLVHLYPGNIIMGGLIVTGGTMVVQPVFEPGGFVDLLSKVRASACAGVPTTYAMLNRLPDQRLSGLDLGALRVAFSAGAPLPASIQHEFNERFGTAPVLDIYGITEAAGSLTCCLRYGETPERSCGVPYPRTAIRIVDAEDRDVPVGEVGELIARGPQLMTEYWQQPEATASTLRGGWLHTGDLARFDDDGFVYIVDRKQDMIITGGYNVYPAEVEDVLQAHPGVALCAVFGVADEIKGEKPWAAVVPTGDGVDSATLDAHCRESLAAYKVPRRFLIVDDLPRSSIGKLLRAELRRMYSAAQ